jgi:F0F1-type ATP synthase membrane subunit b/b'
MSNSDQTLQQLLEVEKEAASIVKEAQTKADDMIAEADRQARLSYNDRYKEAVAALDKERDAAAAKLQADYDHEITHYQKELDAQKLNAEAFNNIVRASFFSAA